MRADGQEFRLLISKPKAVDAAVRFRKEDAG
jgi:hypothetical protein